MNKNTKIIVAIIVLIFFALAFWKYSTKDIAVPVNSLQDLEKATTNDSIDAIDTNLNSVNVNGNVDEDLKGINADLNKI